MSVNKIKEIKKRKNIMGMAASQARFLGLTARKTNVEYEGQQINQQRTALGNQSANYYNQMLGMTVPKPPSVNDFTKTVYSFEDGNLKNTITSLIAQTGGKYLVSYLREWQDDFAIVSAAPAIITRTGSSGSYAYEIGGQTLYALNNSTGRNDEYWNSLSSDNRTKLLAQETEQITLLTTQFGSSTNGWMVRYVKNNSTGAYEAQFFNKDVLENSNTVYGTNGQSQTHIPAYKVGSQQRSEEIKGVNAKLEQDATGRIINITMNPDTANERTYALTTNTITDQAAYDDAINQYQFNKYQYDQTIQEVNAKIEVIQVQDKNLELRLKQLDTEHNAIQTEMDAVSKVIEKNVESTFKTFG
jgi:hypothetical protein